MQGEKLKLVRIENKMTLRELSKKAGISPGFISQIERNKAKPSISTLRKIAHVLNTTIVYFLMDNMEEHLITRKDDRKIIKLADYSQLRQKMGQRSRQLIDTKFCWREIAKDYIACFNGVLR